MAVKKIGRKVSEIAEALGITEPLILDHIRAGRLRAVNVGCSADRPRWLILDADLDAFLVAQASTSGDVANA